MIWQGEQSRPPAGAAQSVTQSVTQGVTEIAPTGRRCGQRGCAHLRDLPHGIPALCSKGAHVAQSRSKPATIISIANQKGGVAKTTSVASLGAAFAEQGRRVLLVDLDAQACLTFSLGVDPDEVDVSINEVLLGQAHIKDAIVECADGVDLVPSVIDLAGAEAQLLPRPGREYVLRSVLEDVRGDYDVVMLDCSPSLGVLTLNALTASQGLIIPMPCEMLSHRGVGQLLDTVADVQRILNKDLEVLGILPTLFDGRSNHAQEVLADVGGRYGLPVLSPPIPKTVRFAEAPAVGRSILATSRRSKGAAAYREVAAAIAKLL
jgi:chromosome partitioning protein